MQSKLRRLLVKVASELGHYFLCHINATVMVKGLGRELVVSWLGFTALQHNIGYIAPVSVVNVRMSAHAGLVGSYHLAPSNSG